MTELLGRRFLSRSCLPAVVMMLAAMTLVVGGCGGSNDGVPQGRNVSVSGQYGPLQIVLSAFTVYQRGQIIAATVTLTNTGAQDVFYEYGGCEEYYVPVAADDTPEGQETIYLRDPTYDGCGGGIRGQRLRPGETRKFYVQWDQTQNGELVPPGRYRLRAVFDAGLTDASGAPLLPTTENSRATTPLEITTF